MILLGLVLLEICTGAPMIPGSFLQEIEDHFCDRSFPSCSTPEDTKAVGSLRHLLIDIFSKHDASVKSLLTSHVFSSVPLPLASPRLKLSSAEKGLVKSAMKVSKDMSEAFNCSILRTISVSFIITYCATLIMIRHRKMQGKRY